MRAFLFLLEVIEVASGGELFIGIGPRYLKHTHACGLELAQFRARFRRYLSARAFASTVDFSINSSFRSSSLL